MRRCCVAAVVLICWVFAQIDAFGGVIRMVTYNTASAGDFSSPATARTGFETIIDAIGRESVNGAARPIDVLALQEQSVRITPTGASTTSQDIANRMNAIYGAGTYAAAPIIGDSTGAGTQGLVYNTKTVRFYAAATVGQISSSGPAREELRYKLGIKGYGNYADFYLYNGHWKAGQTSTDQNRRQAEAQALRADADLLPPGTPIVYAGDFNVYTGSDRGFAALTAAGAGTRAIDPANRIGNWHNNIAFIDIHTQAPAIDPPGSLTGGGLNDRFDFLMPNNLAMQYYAAGSYHTFGNNGSVGLSKEINNPSSTALAGFSDREEILMALTTVSDHLPVVIDFDLPAIPGSSFAPPPMLSPSVPEPSTGCAVMLIGLIAMRTRV